MTHDEALVIWVKDARGSWKVHSRAPEYACGQVGAQNAVPEPGGVKYARIDGEMLQLPSWRDDIGRLSICDRCVNQLTCDLNNREVIMRRADILPSS